MTSLELMGVSVDAPRSVVRDLTVTLGTRDNEVRLAVLLGPADFDGAPLARILVGTAACAEGRITLAVEESLRAGLARALMRLPSVVVIDATGRNAEAEVMAESGDAEPAACRLAGYVLDRWPHTGVLVLTGDEAVAAWARGRAGRVVRMDGTGQCLVDADPTGKGAG